MGSEISPFLLVDSDVLIDWQRGIQQAAEQIAIVQRLSVPAVSVVTRMELIVGSQSREYQQRTEKLLRPFRVVQIDEQISLVANDLVTRFYLSSGLLLPDALIAATALVHRAPLLTKNQRDFQFIPELNVLPYPGAAS
ncbi:type II toxin-antitoxin system VapC family toxin [Hymenobacter weizhouensis]|uniref:type II toxin-antitoxin system VapC family toxin n=1 Tax=Hymenobacter sp. YIM 151500-1 TaxID=2987689 RepID=UPI0022279B9C|nr:type II toxin-antitoxin system VapC family toxin [Hymenobacter sp. YIM 151500-1]UYZ63018.1 type II toxin-antitoxin system VapC family toxin [Hymenobacter sp. YIM 151500-1]